MNAPAPEPVQIRRALDVLHPPGAVIELRALHKGRKRTDAGYFDSEHRAELIDAAAKLNAQGAAVYISLNRLDPQLLARHANRVQDFAAATATDANVTQRRWLLIDLDPQRPKDTSATGEQLEAVKALARKVYEHLNEMGWPRPVVADSGNGMHLLYRIDQPNDEVSRELIKGCLDALAARFDDDGVRIDRSVFNAARIIKLHGTVANKGDNLPSAPWRLSQLRNIPEKLETVTLEQLKRLASEIVPPPKPNGHASAGAIAWTETDVAAFLERGNIQSSGPDSHNGALRWKLKACPFNPDHGPTESAVFLAMDGKLGFKCMHNSCTERHWRDLRTLVDGERPRAEAPVRKSAAQAVLAAKNDLWQAPRPLPEGLPPVAPFDYELLPPALQRRVEDVAERMQCPPDFPAVALMVMLSSLVGRRQGIAPKRADDWVVVPNLWGMVIGRPGIMKSPPLTEITKPLQVLQARARDVFTKELSEYQGSTMVAEEAERVAKDAIRKLLKDGKTGEARDRADEAVARKEEQQPTCRRYVVNDSTVEKLGEILNQNPHGVLLFRDELNGFFRTLERQGHEADRAFYLESWNGDNSFTYDRIGRGTLHIAGACLSIMGSIQPGPLTDIVRGLRGSGDDGLLQRFQLAVWPDITTEWRNVDRQPDQGAREDVQRVIERLDKLTTGTEVDSTAIPSQRFSPEAQEMFDYWRESLERRLRSDTEHAMVEAHLAKYRSLVPSLALLMHLAEADTDSVGLLPLERAIAWAEYLESHARRIYAPAISPDMDAARLLAKRIQKGEVGDRFALRDVYNNGWSGLSTRDEVAAAAAVLIDHDWLREVEEPTEGRTRTAFRVNPAVQRSKP